MLVSASLFPRSFCALQKARANLRQVADHCLSPSNKGKPLTFSQGVARAVELRAELSALVDALPSLDADALPSLDGNAAVRLDDVEALISMKAHLGSWEWEARKAALESYRMAMSEHLPPAQQLRMLLDQADGGELRWKGVLKDSLLDLLASPAATTEDISAAWQLVRKGQLSLPASAASPEFIRHVLSDVSDPPDPPERNNEGNRRIEPGESFLVQLAFGSTDADTDAVIALRLSEESSPRLSYQPSATPVRFEGELLSQLHASLPARQLSPAVRFRRCVGVIFNNVRDEAYRYDPSQPLVQDVSSLKFYGGGGISVELPHLTYALVERVEVDVETRSWGPPVVISDISPGTEVVLPSYRDPPPPKPSPKGSLPPPPPPLVTLTATMKPADQVVPCVHVSIDLSGSATVHAVRVYGRAISW